MNKKLANLLLIGAILILTSIVVYHSYRTINEFNNIERQEEAFRESCLNMENPSPNEEKICASALSEKPKIDFFTFISNSLVFGLNKVSFFLFLFVAIPSLWYITSYLKNRGPINDLARMNYKKVKAKMFNSAYRCVIIIPITVIIAFIIGIIYTKTFDPTYALKYSTTGWSENVLSRPYLFIFLYILNCFIHSILYVNLTLCIARKHHNYFIALILSFLLFLGIEGVLEILFGNIGCSSLIKTDYGVIFNIMNMLAFNGAGNIFLPLLVPFILMVITMTIVYFMYKDKEKLIIDVEKNEV